MKKICLFVLTLSAAATAQAATFKVTGFGSFTDKAPRPTQPVAQARAEQAALDKCMNAYRGQPIPGTQKTSCEDHVAESDGINIWIISTCTSELSCEN